MSEAYLEYLLETESDENVIWSEIDKFNDYLEYKNLDETKGENK